MKRIFLGMVLAVAMLGFIGSAFASPAMNGSMGLFRVLDANNAGQGSFNLGLYGIYAAKSETYGSSKVDFTNISLHPGIAFSPLKFLEISASVPYVYALKAKSDSVTYYDYTGLQDAEVGLKFSYPFSRMFAVGLRGVVMVPTMADTFKTVPGLPRKSSSDYWIKNAPVVGGQVLFTVNVMDKAKIHLNGGAMYSLHQVDTASVTSSTLVQAFTKPNTKISVPYGFGLEFNGLPWVTPMVEVSGNYTMWDDNDTALVFRRVLGDFRIQKTSGGALVKPGPLDQGIFITPGVKADFPISGAHHLALALGVDIPYSSTRVDPSWGNDSLNAKAYRYAWQVIGGLTYQYIPRHGPRIPPTGSVAGLVTDTNNKPIAGADLAFTGTQVASVTSNADGKFTAVGLPVGMVSVSASKEGYNSKDQQVTIAKHKVASMTIALEKKPIPKATMAGKVADTEGKAVANATVKVEGSTATTDVSGSYSMDVVVAEAGGTYNATVTAPGYIDKGVSVALMPGQPLAKDFTLLSQTLKMKLVVNFATNKYNIVGQSDDIARAAQILKDNPTARAEIAGYTDVRGSSRLNLRLSRNRALSVMNALIADGVPASQLTSNGYGAGDPVASNKTAAGRAMNRRIELHIVQTLPLPEQKHQ